MKEVDRGRARRAGDLQRGVRQTSRLREVEHLVQLTPEQRPQAERAARLSVDAHRAFSSLSELVSHGASSSRKPVNSAKSEGS